MNQSAVSLLNQNTCPSEHTCRLKTNTFDRNQLRISQLKSKTVRNGNMVMLL